MKHTAICYQCGKKSDSFESSNYYIQGKFEARWVKCNDCRIKETDTLIQILSLLEKK